MEQTSEVIEKRVMSNHKTFFSTKRGGTGLGLAIVKKIVEVHGGEVFCYPNPERGVTFVVGLPIRIGTLFRIQYT